MSIYAKRTRHARGVPATAPICPTIRSRRSASQASFRNADAADVACHNHGGMGSDRMKTGVGGPGWRVPEPFEGPPVRWWEVQRATDGMRPREPVSIRRRVLAAGLVAALVPVIWLTVGPGYLGIVVFANLIAQIAVRIPWSTRRPERHS